MNSSPQHSDANTPNYVLTHRATLATRLRSLHKKLHDTVTANNKTSPPKPLPEWIDDVLHQTGETIHEALERKYLQSISLEQWIVGKADGEMRPIDFLAAANCAFRDQFPRRYHELDDLMALSQASNGRGRNTLVARRRAVANVIVTCELLSATLEHEEATEKCRLEVTKHANNPSLAIGTEISRLLEMEFEILLHLSKCQTLCDQTDIATAVDANRATVAKHLKSLETKGYIEHAQRGRKDIRITAKGREVVAQLER
jgi:predicted transcriptional regulator